MYYPAAAVMAPANAVAKSCNRASARWRSELTARLIPHVDQNTRSGRLYASTRRELIARLGDPTSVQLSHIDIACRTVVSISELRADHPRYEKRLADLNRSLATVNRYLFGPDYRVASGKRQRKIKSLSELIAEAKDVA
jgi:hypothetical protein